MNYDPQIYQSFGGTKRGGFGQEFTLGNVQIKNFRGEPLTAGAVYIGKREDFPSNTSILYQGNYLNGKPGIFVGERPL